MTTPDAPRPPAGTGGRAGDQQAKRIEAHRSCTAHTGEGYPRGTTLAVLDRLDRSGRRCMCECCHAAAERVWFLRDDLRPADFATAVAGRLIDVEDLAVPLVEVDR